MLRSFWYTLWPYSIFYGYLVYFFLFWYVVPRKIWQPWVQHQINENASIFRIVIAKLSSADLPKALFTFGPISRTREFNRIQGDQVSVWKKRPNYSPNYRPNRFMSKLMHNFFHGKSSPIYLPTFSIVKKLPKVHKKWPNKQKLAQSGHADRTLMAVCKRWFILNRLSLSLYVYLCLCISL
jgi:hypothetical protein